MAKKVSLTDVVIARLPRKGFAPWTLKVPPDVMDELNAIKAMFYDGKMPSHTTKTGLCKAISDSLTERGIAIGIRGVERWFAEKT